MIAILDYGVGNIHAFLTIFKRLNILARKASKLEDLANVSKLILPGVGSFDYTMQRFNNSGLRAVPGRGRGHSELRLMFHNADDVDSHEFRRVAVLC